jgi:hypothetical protein
MYAIDIHGDEYQKMGILRAFSATCKVKRLLAVCLHPSTRLNDKRNTHKKANT